MTQAEKGRQDRINGGQYFTIRIENGRAVALRRDVALYMMLGKFFPESVQQALETQQAEAIVDFDDLRQWFDNPDVVEALTHITGAGIDCPAAEIAKYLLGRIEVPDISRWSRPKTLKIGTRKIPLTPVQLDIVIAQLEHPYAKPGEQIPEGAFFPLADRLKELRSVGKTELKLDPSDVVGVEMIEPSKIHREASGWWPQAIEGLPLSKSRKLPLLRLVEHPPKNRPEDPAPAQSSGANPSSLTLPQLRSNSSNLGEQSA